MCQFTEDGSVFMQIFCSRIFAWHLPYILQASKNTMGTRLTVWLELKHWLSSYCLLFTLDQTHVGLICHRPEIRYPSTMTVRSSHSTYSSILNKVPEIIAHPPSSLASPPLFFCWLTMSIPRDTSLQKAPQDLIFGFDRKKQMQKNPRSHPPRFKKKKVWKGFLIGRPMRRAQRREPKR